MYSLQISLVKSASASLWCLVLYLPLTTIQGTKVCCGTRDLVFVAILCISLCPSCPWKDGKIFFQPFKYEKDSF